MKFENLSPELQEKARACKTAEDLLNLAKTEGYELSDEELEAISAGGEFWDGFVDLLTTCNMLGH